MFHTHLDIKKLELFKQRRDECPIYWDGNTNAWYIYKYKDIIDILLNEDTYTSCMGDQLEGISEFTKNDIILNSYSINQNAKQTKVFFDNIHNFFTQKVIDLAKTNQNIINKYIDLFKNKNINFTKTLNLYISFDTLASLFDLSDSLCFLYKNILFYNDTIINNKMIYNEIQKITLDNIENIPFYKYLIKDLQKTDLARINYQKQLCSDFITSTMINALSSMYGAINIIIYCCYTYNNILNNLSIENINSFVKESMRYCTLDARFARKVIKETYINNTFLDIGDNVVLLTGSSNFDEEIFGTNTEEFNINRPLKKITLEFGFGPHFCLAYRIIQSQITHIASYLHKNKNLYIDNVIYENNIPLLGSPIKEVYGSIHL